MNDTSIFSLRINHAVTEIRIEAGEALDLISIQISKVPNSFNFETFTAMTLKLQEVANLVMFFHVMQTIHFVHVCVR